MDDAGLAEYLDRAKAGDASAIHDLVRMYEPLVRIIVRGKLPRVMRSRFDTMDFVQLVWKSVFAEDGPDLGKFQNKQHFLGFLSSVARNKIYEEHRRSDTLKYDVGREEPLYVRKGNREVSREVAGNGSTPSAEAQVGDRLAQMLNGRSDFSAKVVDLRRQGLTFDEIAARLGVHESVPRRVIKEMRERMETRGWR